MSLNWEKSIDELHKMLNQMTNIMELTLHDCNLSELDISKLPNLLTLTLVNCIVDVDVYMFMDQFDKLFDIELVNCTIWIAHKKSLIIKKCLMSGQYGLEYTENMSQIKRLQIKYCSQMQCLMKDIKCSQQLLINNANIKDIVQLPLKHLQECVLLNVLGELHDLKLLIGRLPSKFYIKMDKYTIHSQNASFSLVDLKKNSSVRSINLDRGVVQISSSSKAFDLGNMIPVLLLS